MKRANQLDERMYTAWIKIKINAVSVLCKCPPSDKVFDGSFFCTNFSQVLSFGSWFDQPLSGVQFPDSLTILNLGRDFNQPLEGIVWPKRLARLTFGFFFNQSIEVAAENWPSSLLHVSLGDCYNLPIGDIFWPRGLAEVSVAMAFIVRARIYKEAFR